MKIATRAFAGLCLAAVVAAAPVAARDTQEKPQGQQSQRDGDNQERRSPWWRDAAVQKELGLSPQQVAKLEKIWASKAPRLRELHHQLEAHEAETNRLIRENTADEKVLAQQLDRMEAVRSQLNTARTLVVYRMHQTLTPEQYRKLSDINDRRRKERGRR